MIESLSLPSLENGYEVLEDDKLLPILPRFLVPRLEDRPQNPILDTLKSVQESTTFWAEHPVLLQESVDLAELQLESHAEEDNPSNIWSYAASKAALPKRVSSEYYVS